MTKAQLTEQSPEDIRLQKYRSSLFSSGGAIVLFSLWTVLRSIIQIYSQFTSGGNSEELTPIIMGMAGACILDLILKLYVGLSARVEGLSRKKKRPYLTLGIIIAILSVLSLVYMIYEFSLVYQMFGLLGAIISLAVEATGLYVAMDLVVSAVRVRKLEKEMGRV